MAERRNATETYVQNQLGLYVPKSLFDANSILKADADDTPVALPMGASTILARLAAGTIKAASVAEIAALIAPALPGYELGYDAITSNVVIASTTEASGTVVIACAAHTFDGSPVIAEFFSPGVLNQRDNITHLNLFEGATEIGRLYMGMTGNGAVPGQWSVVGSLRFTPSAGSHTYTLTAHSTITTYATIRAGSGGTGNVVPAYMRFTKAVV